jgi:hypothetical protein
MGKIKAFLLGVREFRSDFTTAFGPDEDDLMLAYDWGREWAHRLTFRYWDGEVE